MGIAVSVSPGRKKDRSMNMNMTDQFGNRTRVRTRVTDKNVSGIGFSRLAWVDEVDLKRMASRNRVTATPAADNVVCEIFSPTELVCYHPAGVIGGHYNSEMMMGEEMADTELSWTRKMFRWCWLCC